MRKSLHFLIYMLFAAPLLLCSSCGIEDVELAKTPLYTTDGSGERSGMGFTIMESFMDKLTVKSTPGKGTVVSMRKRIVPRLSGRR